MLSGKLIMLMIEYIIGDGVKEIYISTVQYRLPEKCCLVCHVDVRRLNLGDGCKEAKNE